MTKKGWKTYAKLQEGGTNLGKNVLSLLSEKEKSQLSDILDKIIQTLDRC